MKTRAKHLSWIGLAIGLFLTSLATRGDDKPAALTTSPAGEKWKLIWSDEFDHDGPPDPAKWTYEIGFVRNNEPQYYTDRRENARVENGMLVLEARKEHFKNPNVQPGAKNRPNRQEFAEYTSASVITRGLFQFAFGRVEMRLQLPEGKGTWPAVWTLGTNRDTLHWPGCGEIDIMEWWGANPKVMTSTLHFAKDNKHARAQGRTTQPAAITGFHDYALEWTPDHMDFFMDGQPYHHVELRGLDDNNAFTLPQYLLIDFAIDSHNKIDDATLPQKFLVDYVRVFEEKE